jgi:hypothetical protein
VPVQRQIEEALAINFLSSLLSFTNHWHDYKIKTTLINGLKKLWLLQDSGNMKEVYSDGEKNEAVSQCRSCNNSSDSSTQNFVPSL